jgi:hypothetical protein
MKSEEELSHLRAEKQALKEQPGQRDELIGQLLQRVQALEERLSKDNYSTIFSPLYAG